ncbi:MAG TPA: ATP-binding protein, partial [Pyrinomonadaceae bacterium]|nr:ATP-binding protein [Pyrinomonadaceae bacterium]
RLVTIGRVCHTIFSMTSSSEPRWIGYLVAVSSVSAVTLVLKLLGDHVNATTVSLALLLNVLFIATRWGSLPALTASVVAMLCFNFFFLPPLGTFTIAATDNWIALFAFLITAVTAGQLSARAKKRAEEAESGKREIGRLFAELREAFERASHAEALRQSEKLKSALLDAVTHDLRTPLTSIKASITTLLDEQREPPMVLDRESRVEMMEVIDEESDRLNRFINGLIELARIEAGELQLRRRWSVVDEIISAALTRAEPITRQHRIEVDVEKELPAVRIDERAVSEVVYTLIDNAAKYSASDSLIRISARRAEDDLIQMSVEDEGRGVPPDVRERVFDKFFRATRDGDVSTRQPTGTGMGLAIAKGIIEAHGGRIWIEPAATGKGTRVVFTLPIGDEDAAQEPQYSVSAAEKV